MSSKRFVLLASSVTVALTAVVVSAFGASDPCLEQSEACAAVAPDAELAGLEEEDAAAAAANWTHYGCISLGGNCYDVFQDSKGNLWVCQECFTTQNPNPKKCRKLTPSEIANALWCA